MNYDRYAKKIYEQNVAVGWWDDPDRCLYTTMQLVSTEVAEGTEGERKNLMDDHLPHRRMGEVELADALIRVLDLGGKLGLSYDLYVPYMNWAEPGNTIGKQHLAINCSLVSFAYDYDTWTKNSSEINFEELNRRYSELINTIARVADNQKYDLKSAADEKLLFNLTRADHQRDARKEEHGKAF